MSQPYRVLHEIREPRGLGSYDRGTFLVGAPTAVEEHAEDELGVAFVEIVD